MCFTPFPDCLSPGLSPHIPLHRAAPSNPVADLVLSGEVISRAWIVHFPWFSWFWILPGLSGDQLSISSIISAGTQATKPYVKLLLPFVLTKWIERAIVTLLKFLVTSGEGVAPGGPNTYM